MVGINMGKMRACNIHPNPARGHTDLRFAGGFGYSQLRLCLFETRLGNTQTVDVWIACATS